MDEVNIIAHEVMRLVAIAIGTLLKDRVKYLVEYGDAQPDSISILMTNELILEPARDAKYERDLWFFAVHVCILDGEQKIPLVDKMKHDLAVIQR